MTTAPKATRFRTRQGTVTPAAEAGTQTEPGAQSPFEPTDDGFGDEPFPTAAAAQRKPAAPAGDAGSTDLAAIEAEGISGRKLRIARRIAAKQGLTPRSDHDAVRLLRLKGIDPFDPANLLKIVARSDAPAGAGVPGAVAGAANLPQTMAGGERLPAPTPLTPADRATEIRRIQRDIVRRRRRRFTLLMARLAIFVGIPTILAGVYFTMIATPLYATKTEFVIQQAEAQSSGIGSLFRGTQFATSQDAIAVQSYLQSRDAMMRLDQDLGFRAHFSQENLDPIQRLDPDATVETAYKLYRKNVKISFDPTEGIVKMEVVAADPQVAKEFSEALLRYAEERVDELTLRLRSDQMQGAEASFQDAEAKVQFAQRRILELQEKMGILDPATESSSVLGQVSALENQLQKKRLERQQLLDNPRPNKARVAGVEGDISRLENLIAELRAPLTESVGSSNSLAKISGEIRIAEGDLQTRQLLLSQAMEQLETARIEANRQVRYLSVSVSPFASDAPAYPRAFEDTLLAFLIFAGIYLLLSLTAAVLREQVTS